MEKNEAKGDSLLESEWVSGWKFAVTALSILACQGIFLGGILAVPAGSTPLSSFARDFQVWCLGYQPMTGLSLGAIGGFLAGPIIVSLFLLVVWGGSIGAAARRDPIALFQPVGVGIMVSAGFAAALYALFSPASTQGTLEFPARELRTMIPGKPLTLINQAGSKVSLADFAGKVVIITGVYARCGLTCPTILKQVKQVFEGAPTGFRDDLRIIAITLDPEKDTPKVLAQLAEGQGVTTPHFNFVTGEPSVVNETLDRYEFSRRRNPETGIIEHSNLFFLIDRSGRQAYRFSIGDLQEKWMGEATRLLLTEEGPSQRVANGS